MNERIKRIQDLFRARFGIELKEHELYGTLAPRLMRQMDEFVNKEISDAETIGLTDYLSKKLHGKSILPEKKEEAASSSNIKELEESQTKPSTIKKKRKE